MGGSGSISAVSVAQMLLSGVALGGVYAVVGLGLTLVFGVMRVINIAHGEFLMLGGFITYFLFIFGISPLVALPFCLAVLFALGLVLHHTLVRRTVNKPELASLLLTFGISVAIVGGALVAWGSDYRSVPYLNTSLQLGPVFIGMTKVLAFGLAMALSLLFYLFMRYLRIGHAIRATAQVQDMAMICGIHVGLVHVISFGIGAALAGAGGSLLSMMYAVFPEMGLVFTIKAFAIIVLGGIGNFLGAFLAGLILGVAETLGSLLFSVQATEAIAFILLIVTLLVRPEGLLFGERE
jgi:branched-chain amino acid transport system permease protein